MRTTVDVNNDIIYWAISRAGYEPEDFYTLYPKTEDWLERNKKPTLTQLKKFSHKVHLPFGYLFLDQPPEEEIPIPYYRTLQGESNEVSLNVRETILTHQKRQDWLRDFQIENGHDPLDFVGRFSRNSQIGSVIKDIQDTLGLNVNWASVLSNWQAALDQLAERVEDNGIIIVFNSVVGNNTHRPVSVEECRGFVLTDEYAPFMFVNSADSKSAQMFTIVHELAHIWIGKSAGFDFRQLQPANNDIEKFCDRVAAEFLVPEQAFHEAWSQNQNFKALSKQFKVSQIVIARRALDLGEINRDTFFEFYNNHIQQHFQKKKSQESGGDFYATLRKRLNLTFISTVNRAVRENKLLHRDAYELTGLRGSTYESAITEYQL